MNPSSLLVFLAAGRCVDLPGGARDPRRVPGWRSSRRAVAGDRSGDRPADGARLDALGASYERWDGKGWPGEREGERIPLPARVIQLAEFAEVAHRNHGIGGAVEVAGRGSATQFDPNLVAILRADAEKIFRSLDEVSSWEAVLAGEPALRVLSAAELDEALAAIVRFVDLKSPFMLGHSQAVATLARDAACLDLPAAERTRLYRAGLTGDSGAWACRMPSGTSRGRSPSPSGNASASRRSSRSECCADPRRWHQ